MNTLLETIPMPAAMYNIRDKRITINTQAEAFIKDQSKIEMDLKTLACKAVDKVNTEVCYDTFIIDGDEYLISYFLFEVVSVLLVFQRISQMKSVFEQTFLFKELKKEINAVLEATHDDILISDGQGYILQVQSCFEKFYGVKAEEVLGKNVFELEKLGIFNPSITARVLVSGEKITMVQENKFNDKIVVTAVPIRDRNGDISKVISFSHDITEFFKLKEQYDNLENMVKIYTAELEMLRSRENSYANIVSKSKQIQDIIMLVSRIVDFDANIIIYGESGVGKTMFARMIHNSGKRKDGPMIEVNCGAIPETLLESEFFGYEGGAFTGAKKEGKIGLVELAKNGTLFLDEISELPLFLQVKLLKVIQDKTFVRVGGTKTIKVDFRLITATNENLEEMVKNKKFREDLYYRLNVISMRIPALREHRDDIFPLCMHFLNEFNKKYGMNKSISSTVIDRLLQYNWPGNVRELENIVERMLLTSAHSIVTEECIPANIKPLQKTYFNCDECSYDEAFEKFEMNFILDAYKKYKTSVAVAKALNISQSNAIRKIKKYSNNDSQK